MRACQSSERTLGTCMYVCVHAIVVVPADIYCNISTHKAEKGASGSRMSCVGVEDELRPGSWRHCLPHSTQGRLLHSAATLHSTSSNRSIGPPCHCWSEQETPAALALAHNAPPYWFRCCAQHHQQHFGDLWFACQIHGPFGS